MKSEARPTGMQVKREANLLTLFGLDTKYTICLITSSCSRFFSNKLLSFSIQKKSFRQIYTSCSPLNSGSGNRFLRKDLRRTFNIDTTSK